MQYCFVTSSLNSVQLVIGYNDIKIFQVWSGGLDTYSITREHRNRMRNSISIIL